MIYVNDIPVTPTLFPDNTSQVWKLPESLFEESDVQIKWEFTHEGEFLHLAQLAQLLYSRGVGCSLLLKYLPYGRQDKDVSNDATFALHTFSYLLNCLHFEEVVITDPHSDKAEQLIINSRARYPIYKITLKIKLTKTDCLCYPDKGALTKYTEILDFPYIYGEKIRDQSTGHILNYKLIGDAKDKTILIVDDICDGGATFKLLAKELYDNGAKEVNLFVTHGIFSKGLKTLYDSGIKRVFTKDGEASEHDNNITYRRL